MCASAIALFEQEYNDELEKLQNNVNLNAKDKERLEILQDKGPQKIIYADLENTLDAEWCDKLGLDLESPLIKFYKAQGQSAEEIFDSAAFDCIRISGEAVSGSFQGNNGSRKITGRADRTE